MTKIAKIMLLVFFCWVAYCVYGYVKYAHHSIDWNVICKQYMWFFKDTFKNDIYFTPGHPVVCTGYPRKQDIYNIFHYHHDSSIYSITIWEFKDFKNFDLNKISINKDIFLNSFKIWPGSGFGEVLESQSYMPITIKNNFEFKHNMDVNLNEFSKIDGTFSGANYKGFYGTIDQMSFSDEKGRHQIFFGGDHQVDLLNWHPKIHEVAYIPTVFILYKGHQSFYVIIIHAKEPFKDASIIDILNLT